MIAGQARPTASRQSLNYGSESIDFTLTFSPRRRLSVIVQPDGGVVVNAPTTATMESVMEHIQKRAGWIVRQRDYFASFGPPMPPKQYVNGETHRYLGRQYRLRIRQGNLPSVKLVGRYFEIVAPDRDNVTAIRQQLDAWYRQRALVVFGQHLNSCLKSSYLRRLRTPKWSIRHMKRRWGSCTKNGTILLNTLLIHAPLGCIDYVITHELCHLIHHRHDAVFYRLLGRVMFDWRKWKERLEQFSR